MQKLARVLLVDDDPTTLFLHSQLLRQWAVAEQVVLAHNGVEALHALERLCQELVTESILVLLDVHMPVMDGIAFLKAYQQQSPVPQCPVVIIVLTTSERGHELDPIRELATAAAIITKPLSRDKMDAILRQHFQRSLPA